MKIETACLHGGYRAGNGEPQALPIYQSTTYRYHKTKDVAGLFDLTVEGHMYSRISNPTVAAVEEKIAKMEGGVGALCTSSGQAASLVTMLNLLKCGDRILCASTIYGGTFNLFNVTFKRMGIGVDFVDINATKEEIVAAIKPETKVVFGETIANPTISVLDIETFAAAAHEKGLPLVIDNTFATPYLCRPFEYGADIVIHSTTKYLDGHAEVVGGVIVDSGNFPWDNGNFPEFTTPDDSYHGVVYTKDFGKAAFITKARVQMMRDLGCYQSAQGAFLLNNGIETLAVRMERHCSNADKVAHWLAQQDKVEMVSYPTLENDPYHERAKKYLPKGCSGVIAFNLKGGRDAGVRFIDSLEMISLVVHVADIRTCVLHPASSTHRQLSDEQLVASGITPGLIRLSVGLEDVDDIIADLEQALKNA